VNNLLSAYLDGELCGVEHRQVHEHLTRCAECQSEYEGLLQMKRLLGRLRVKEASAEFPSRMLSAISSDTARRYRPQLSDWLHDLKDWFRAAAPVPQGLALGAGLALVGLYVVTSTYTPEESLRWSPVVAADVVPLSVAREPEDGPGGPAMFPPRPSRPLVSVPPSPQLRPVSAFPSGILVSSPLPPKNTLLPRTTSPRVLYVRHQ
jgi:anti-sigma factor RsiW